MGKKSLQCIDNADFLLMVKRFFDEDNFRTNRGHGFGHTADMKRTNEKPAWANRGGLNG